MWRIRTGRTVQFSVMQPLKAGRQHWCNIWMTVQKSKTIHSLTSQQQYHINMMPSPALALTKRDFRFWLITELINHSIRSCVYSWILTGNKVSVSLSSKAGRGLCCLSTCSTVFCVRKLTGWIKLESIDSFSDSAEALKEIKTSRENLLEDFGALRYWDIDRLQINVWTAFLTFCSLSTNSRKKNCNPLEMHERSAVTHPYTPHGSPRDWQPLVPAKNHCTLNQAGITAFSLSSLLRRLCSISLKCCSRSYTKNTNKYQTSPSNTHTRTHKPSHAHTQERWMSHPWHLQQVTQIKQLCINCLGDHAGANVTTGAKVKSSRRKRCSRLFSLPLVEMIMPSQAAMLTHRSYELKNARYLGPQYTGFLFSKIFPPARLFTHTPAPVSGSSSTLSAD